VLENGVKLGNKPHKPIQLLDYLPAHASGTESSRKLETTFSYLFLGNPSCFLDQHPPYQTVRHFGMRETPLVSRADILCCVDVSQQSWEGGQKPGSRLLKVCLKSLLNSLICCLKWKCSKRQAGRQEARLVTSRIFCCLFGRSVLPGKCHLRTRISCYISHP